MITLPDHAARYSTARRRRLKHGLLVALALITAAPPAAIAQVTRPATRPTLRDELAELLRTARPDAAVQRAQAALRARPTDPAVRAEYVALHLGLAREWIAGRHFADAQAALEAVLALDPHHAEAQRLQVELRTARQRASDEITIVDNLLRLELFDAALDRISETQALRPDLADELRDAERTARRGVAEDHYLARNFQEAFALYEDVLATEPDSGGRIPARWALSLALTLGAADFSRPGHPDAAARLSARAADVLRATREPVLGHIVNGLLAQRAGQLVDAGRSYAAGLGQPWDLPPVEQRAARVQELRRAVLAEVEKLYRDTPVERRAGFWTVALPDTWKRRQTPHFSVEARNDLVAERVAEAAEYHFAGLCAWLGLETPAVWEPRCLLRVHATRADLLAATGMSGPTCAVSHTRLQGEQVQRRSLDVFQADPWLLSSTLPHELTHLLIAEACRQAGPPLVIDEGLALQAEPPARRLMYRLLLPTTPTDPTVLLSNTTVPVDTERFYAEAGVLAAWLLDALDARRNADDPPLVSLLLRSAAQAQNPDWWRSFGFDSAAAAGAAWQAWSAAQRDPPRMPLMIRAEPPADRRRQSE